MNRKTASYRVAQDLRLYRQVDSLQKGIEQMQQTLTMLNMLAMQEERALMVLMELQYRGVTLDEIHDYPLFSCLSCTHTLYTDFFCKDLARCRAVYKFIASLSLYIGYGST